MLELGVLAISILVQFIAAFMALRLMRRVGGRAVWGALSLALTLMAIRRTITFVTSYHYFPARLPDLSAELVALFISVLMLFAIASIPQLFKKLKQYNLALLESEQRFRVLAETSECAIFVYRDTFVYINPAGLKILGYEENELSGMPFWAPLLAEYRERAKNQMNELMSGECSGQRSVVQVKARSGKVRWLDYSVSLVTYDGDDAVLATAFDITESKKTEEALKQSEEKFAKAFHSSPAMICIYEVSSGKCIDVNHTFLQTLGYRRDEVVGVNHIEAGLWQDCEHYNDFLNFMDSVGLLSNEENRLQAKNGDSVYVNVSVEQISLDNEPCLLVLMHDNTAAKREEEERRSRENNMILQQQALLELSRFTVSNRGDVDKLQRRIVLAAATTLNASMASIWLFSDDKGTFVCNCAYLADGDTFHEQNECEFRRFDSYYRELENSLVMVSDNVYADNRYAGMLAYFQDHDTHAVMDASISVGSEVVGILRIEQAASGRAWSLEEQNFTVALAETVALTMEEQKRIEAEHALFHEKELAQITVRSIGDGVISTDVDGNVEFMNPVAEDMCGWDVAEARGLPVMKVLDLVDEVTREPIKDPVTTCFMADTNTRLQGQILLVNHSRSREYSVEVTVSPIRDLNQMVIGMVMAFHDVTELRGMAQTMSYQASHDGLTGLLNRQEFESRLELALESAWDDGLQHAMCYLDLDQFKVVNDTCGHVAGDELLRQLAQQLSSVVDDKDTLARLGGDEFGVLLENTSLDEAREATQELLNVVQAFRFSWESKIFEIGVSIGLVAINADSGGLTDVLSAADSACYVAKDYGRNRIHVFHPEDTALVQHHGQMQWMQRIQQAIADERFVMYLQQIEPLKIGEEFSLHGEFLVRMLSRENGIIPPGEFLPAAERYHLMPMLDRVVLKLAFQAIAEFPALSGIDVFSINLSGQSLSDDGLLVHVMSLFEEYSIDPECICFEITETAVVSNLAHAARLISILRGVGCRFALDDFGSGLSSFAYLKSLPVDYLKIDGRFVSYMAKDASDYAMVESINHIGHVMGMQTIAEYVEDAETMRLLQKLGVDYGQGYGIARPMPASEFRVSKPV